MRLRQKAGALLLAGVLATGAGTAWAQDTGSQEIKSQETRSQEIRPGGELARGVEEKVGQAMTTLQKTQKAQDKWDEKQSKLLAQYHQLLAENKAFRAHRDELANRVDKGRALNQSLEARRFENEKIQREMMPFLTELVARLDTLVKTDVPFLPGERRARMARLVEIVNDVEIGVAEKYRKTMEALAVEAEYGQTVEVYQDKIRVGGEEVLGNIFRLGRVSLFFLSLDQARAAGFNVATGQWLVLDGSRIPAVAACLDIAGKRRPAELVELPLGRLAVKGGE